MSPITYRNYKDVSDLELQTKIWTEATHSLPWAWKPNTTQRWFTEQPNFDPASKLFALDDNNPIGYMSSIRREGYTPMGFPWVIHSRYEGDIQHHLFDTVYDNAVHVSKSKNFLQRFRKEWVYQIKFFEEKGFTLENSNPIYILDITEDSKFSLPHGYEVSLHNSIPREMFLKVLKEDSTNKNQNYENILAYFTDDIAVDWYLILKFNGNPVGTSLVTIRSDTKYAEFALYSSTKVESSINILLEALITQLAKENITHMSMTTLEDSPRIDVLENYSFSKRSDSVFYSKKL